ncbi:MAG: orotidine-5'-phosphate decarboxylase [Bacteroidales bacterium]|jgi:orotidine-5'-phosphate decarboxylase|nr:orotidine-5'-phosphate decarboxylase [Bacteroidales bacterium]
MNRTQLVNLIKQKQSLLCVGLDSDIDKLPACVMDTEDPVFEFNRAIIDATLPFAVAYKPNLAFYESNGVKGMVSLQKTMAYLNNLKTQCFTIADAKRGDIGNTSQQYARAYLSPEGDFNFDAMTVAPYMGSDSVKPFAVYPDKWVVLLALTSNKGAMDFQFIKNESGLRLFEEVILKSQQWAENLMFVAGATQASLFRDIRKAAPNHFLLVPGVGAQGGSIDEVCDNGLTNDYGLLINSSRNIIFADNTADFARVAAAKAEEMCSQTQKYF